MGRREIARRQLFVRIDVRCCIPSQQHRRIADRCGAICTFGIVLTTKRFCTAIERPEVPSGISRVARRTIPGSVELDRACDDLPHRAAVDEGFAAAQGQNSP
jgi:hypothetical protein